MSILQRYLARRLARATSLTLLALLGVFVFLSLIDQLEDAGASGYGIGYALRYVALTVPRLVYELLPIAATIGGMTTLALLGRSRELDIIRLAGVSNYTLAALLGKAALLIALFSALVGELLAPASEKQLRHHHSMAQSEYDGAPAAPGFWAREGNSFINMRSILPNNGVGGVHIYEFDARARLRNSITATGGRYEDGRWLLENVRKTTIAGDEIKQQHYRQAAWESSINPGLVELAQLDPSHLPAWRIHRSIRFLTVNSQNAAPYERALYAKLVRPFTIIALIMLAAPLVPAGNGTRAPGRHVFKGVLAGIMFYYLDSAVGHIGIVYGVSPLFCAVMPTLLLCALIAVLLRRAQGAPTSRV